MHCRCTANTLRIFIRNVAQVDLPLASRLTSSRQLTPVPAQVLSSSARLSARDTISKRLYSSTSFSEPATFEESSSTVPRNDSTSKEGWRFASIKAQNLDGGGSPFAEISPESIDALAAKARSPETSGMVDIETPLKSLYKDLPKTISKDFSKTTRRPFEPPNIARKSRADNATFDSDAIAIGKSSKARDDDTEWTPPKREDWMIQKEKLKAKFPDGYKPMKRLSPDAMAGIRALNAQMPERFTTYALSQEFQVSPEAIRRILKSKWRPSSEEESDREERWFKRGEKVWARYAELGLKPPKKWKQAIKKSALGADSNPVPNTRAKWTMPRTMPQLVTTAARPPSTPVDGGAENSSLSDRLL